MSVNSIQTPAVIVCKASELSSQNNKITITFPFEGMAHNIGVYARGEITPSEGESTEPSGSPVTKAKKTIRKELVLGTDYKLEHSYAPEENKYGIVNIIQNPSFSEPNTTLKNICVYRKIENYQNLDFDVYIDFQGLAGSAVDKLTLMEQDDQLSKSYNIRAPYDDNEPNATPKMELPTANERKKKFVRFDNDGNVIVNDILAGKCIEITEEPTDPSTKDAIKISLKVKDTNENQDASNSILTIDQNKNIALMALGADRGIKIERNKDSATVKLNLADSTLSTGNFLRIASTSGQIKTGSISSESGSGISINEDGNGIKISISEDFLPKLPTLGASLPPAVIAFVVPLVAALGAISNGTDENAANVKAKLIEILQSIIKSTDDIIISQGANNTLVINTRFKAGTGIKFEEKTNPTTQEKYINISTSLKAGAGISINGDTVSAKLLEGDGITLENQPGGSVRISADIDSSIVVIHEGFEKETIQKPEELSADRNSLAAITIGDYAIFAGGQNGTAKKASIDVYKPKLDNSGLEKIQANLESLSVARSHLAAATVGDYVLFAGGMGAGGYQKNTVDVYKLNSYNTGLEKANTSIEGLSEARYALAAATVGDYVIFAGGQDNGTVYNTYYNTVDVYKRNAENGLEKIQSPEGLSTGRSDLAAATVGDYVIFAGGHAGIGDYANAVDVYKLKADRSGLEKVNINQDLMKLSEGRGNLAAATVGDYVIFAGGTGSALNKDNVDVYKLNAQKTGLDKVDIDQALMKLSEVRSSLAAATVGKYVIFAGGRNNTLGVPARNTVDVYKLKADNSGLEKVDIDTSMKLSGGCDLLAATAVGDYVIFAGGQNNIGRPTTLEIYKFFKKIALSEILEFVYPLGSIMFRSDNKDPNTLHGLNNTTWTFINGTDSIYKWKRTK